MIKDLKFAVQCMKYGYNKKMLCGMSLMFIVFAALQFSIGKPINYIIGGVMLIVSPSLYIQMYQTINMSNMVASSPKKYKMQVRVLTILHMLAVIVGLILFSIGIIIKYYMNECPIDCIGYIYVIQGLMNIVILIYMAISYKHYIISSILFFIVFMAVYGVSILIVDGDYSKFKISVSMGVGIALLCTIIGVLMFHTISKLVYKSPIDKHAMQSYLRGEN